jgi:hypothetical protein
VRDASRVAKRPSSSPSLIRQQFLQRAFSARDGVETSRARYASGCALPGPFEAQRISPGVEAFCVHDDAPGSVSCGVSRATDKVAIVLSQSVREVDGGADVGAVRSRGALQAVDDKHGVCIMRLSHHALIVATDG